MGQKGAVGMVVRAPDPRSRRSHLLLFSRPLNPPRIKREMELATLLKSAVAQGGTLLKGASRSSFRVWEIEGQIAR